MPSDPHFVGSDPRAHEESGSMTQPNVHGNSGKFVVYVDPQIEEIIPLFLQHRRDDLESIALALEQADFETIETLGHGMKGSGGGFGFEGITEIGRCLERAAISGNSEVIRKQVEYLSAYLERVVVVAE